MKDVSTATAVSTPRRQAGVDGRLVDLDGERFYRIGHYDRMDPFFMSVVSDSDHWMFLSSTGGLTAGRRDPNNALFPYYTDDRIHDAAQTTGSLSIFRVVRDGHTALWEPFSTRQQGLFRIERALYKSVYGNSVVFEETNHDLGLSFRYSWANSEAYGFVRRSELRNLSDRKVSVELLDGIRNVLPSGVSRRFQLEFSTLVDGYKRTETAEDTDIALFRLSSIPVDTAEPSEALRVNAAWNTGLDSAEVLLSEIQCEAFRAGEPIAAERDIRGRRGAYLVAASLDLAPGEANDWLLVAEVELDAARVRSLMRDVAEPGVKDRVLADVARGTAKLVRIVGETDGLQATADEPSVWRHFANTLFNAMRGGVPEHGYLISREDLKAYVAKTNAPVGLRHEAFLDSLPEQFVRADLMSRVATVGDVDLERLAAEYLPLSFSRRHGDPSRPWNSFSIRLKDDQGKPMLNYQGNWRDIFQNWEALAMSYPEFVEAMVFKFADSSTVDGYNPYRVLREGYEWEILDPEDDWANIGYWGDHQVIYLLRLLEAAERYRPGSLDSLLARKVFTFADVPYRIRSYQDLLRDPRDTIDFDERVNDAALERARAIGSDGKAVLDAEGDLLRANLTEKLLIVALSKLSNFVPGGGIWMNTQRPEWNDANNALVGNGVSMVTLCYLRRYLTFLDQLVDSAGIDDIEIAEPVAQWLADVAQALGDHANLATRVISDADRKALLDRLGAAGTAHRASVYDQASRGESTTVTMTQVRGFIEIALRHADHTIAANRREDGLYHSYNIMLASPGGATVRHLSEMLEGQVAVLSSGLLDPAQAAALLDALRASDLYRADQNSFILYPDRELPHFLDKNIVPQEAVTASALLTAMLERGDHRIVVRDVDGGVHFNSAFRNADHLDEALAAVGNGELGDMVEREHDRLLDLYEDVFHHASFTGRSGTFYKYEGLGSIYWHMVSKLLLAVDEARLEALREGVDADVVDRLARHYEQIRAGIGVHKSPAEYGAVPTDPYSHTPSFSGVQQPGMTGQVKEDVITRASEMGVVVTGGALEFEPRMVRAQEFLDAPAELAYVAASGDVTTLSLDAGTMGFTLCQVPVVLRRTGPQGIVVTKEDGSTRVDGLRLNASDAAAIFERTGEISRLDVSLGLAD
ncbi:hypothetical protein LGT39_10680 [Demequina sp. TTPB684]|uniref:hypothetical protein n=1 Tax=unclassified Demequina TaxID=2620311 RepID=UPI001CF34A9A|nr:MULTISPECIES: hypothetical protein [unclassified Demequina]MCB2413308.1 hypothetical protein [Demequina sp. TTPB684]UPU88972.1 hypothetical protein LGT36_003360 [Demequina sp. TMPB413]